MAKNRADRTSEIRTTLITDNDLKQNDSERVNQALEGIQKDAPNYVNDNITPNNATGAVGYTVEPAALGQLDWVTNKFIQDNYALNLSAAIIMKYTISSWTAEDSNNSGEEDGFYYADIDITDVFEDQNLLFGYTADLGDGLEIVGADKAIFIDANTVRIRRYGDDSLNVIIAGTSDLGSIIDAGVNSNIPPYKNYIYLDTDATGSVGVRSTRTPYATLAAAKAAYQAGDIIAVEKCEIDYSGGERIITTGKDIHIRAIDERKVINIKSQNQITNVGSNTLLKIDGKANLICDSLFSFMIDSQSNASNYFTLNLDLKSQFGALRLESCVANINVDEVDYRGLGNLYNLVSIGTNKDNGVPAEFQDYIKVRYGVVYWGGESELESHVDTPVLYSNYQSKSFHVYNSKFIRTHSEADSDSGEMLRLFGDNVLENIIILDEKNTGHIINNSFSSKTFEIIGSVISTGATGSTFFRDESLVNFTGTGILIHNGKIIYNGSNPNIFV